MNREAVFEQLKIDEGVVNEIYLDHLGIPHLESVTLSSKVTRNSEGQLEHQLLKKESGRVLKETLILPLESVNYYTKMGYLETYQTRSSKSWLI